MNLIPILLFVISSQQLDTLKSIQKDKWFAMDKLHHFSYSLGITTISFHYLHCINHWDYSKSRNYSIGISITLGFLKEIYDLKIKKTFISYKDLFYDFLGIFFAYCLFIYPCR